MKRAIALIAGAFFILSLVAGPAAAKNKVAVFGGVAKVGKNNLMGPGPGCTEDDGEGGLGLPIVTGVKKGTWRISTTEEFPVLGTGFLRTSNGTEGTLVACGQLDTVGRQFFKDYLYEEDGGIGAACGMSKGHNGRGVVTDEGKTEEIHLSDLRWKFTLGGTLPILGHATWTGAKGPAKGRGKVVAIVQAQGGAACLGKATSNDPEDWFVKNNGPKGTGANEFNVVGVAAVLQGLPASLVPKWKNLPGNTNKDPEAQDNPFTCKRDDKTFDPANGDTRWCPIYGPKKPKPA